jgi:hypothetical protein
MKAIKYVLALILVLSLTAPAAAGNGPGGPGGGGGGGGDIPDTGELFGDLYVILRDEFGVPILDGNGCIQPISSVESSTVLPDGTPVEAFVGEPFTLGTYIDSEGVLIECELTEDMATWVQTVDFGRLNLGRSPEGVIAHAFDEAINKLNVATEMDLDPAGRLVLTLVDETTGDLVDKTIDAPAENLALYIKMMTDGDWITVNTDPIVKGGPPEGKGPPEGDGPSSEPRPVLNESAIGLLWDLGFTNLGDTNKTTADLDSYHLTLAASLLAAAADKTGSITLDKVIYINSIYGINQVGTLPGEVEGKSYFNFGSYNYDRTSTYANRSSGGCTLGEILVLQPELDSVTGEEVPGHFITLCMPLLGYDPTDPDPVNAVRFTDMEESYDTVPYTYDFIDNVRAFTQASDDALQVIEYIHNYKVPELLYP